MIEWLLVPLAYILGSLSSAIIVCRLMGLDDPRHQGSGNPGATNVMRIGSKKAAAITLLGDVLKGLIPVVVAQILAVDVIVLASVAFAAFLGHLYSVFFGFKGGKGVATTLGIILGIAWMLGIAISVTWYLFFKISKISSLSAIITAILMPIYAWFMVAEFYLWVMLVFISTMLLWRHKDNINRLITGKER